MSHLTRGAWIEIIVNFLDFAHASRSHLTRGAWIEIACSALIMRLVACRTSHEVRGLKCRFGQLLCTVPSVAPHTRCVD